MGRFPVACCCVCGARAPEWHSSVWEDAGGLQDFCPQHAVLFEFTEYGPHTHPITKENDDAGPIRDADT